MTLLIKEPLVHFIIAAGLVFAAYSFMSQRGSAAERTIYVSMSDMERMAALYATEAGTPPSEQDIRAMVLDYVRQEALVREARKLGLDEGDVVIERRLAQKMTFMVADLGDEPIADDAELRAWFEANGDDYMLPAKVTFQHVFWARPESGGVEAALASLNSGADWKAVGEPFILLREYGDLPARELIRLFGADFAAKVFALEADEMWQGPVVSAYGTHLVRVQNKVAAAQPAFETVRGAVEADWVTAQKRLNNAEAIADIIERYDVVVEGAEP